MNVVFDRAVAFYDRTRGLPPVAEAAIAAAVREGTSLRAGSRVLEVGVGTGRIALPLATRNQYRYTGIDLSRAMMNELRGKPAGDRVALVQADMTRLPFVDESFDAVIAVHVFHLVARWQAAMRETRRVLRPGGLLLAGQSRYDDASGIRELRRRLDAWAGGSEQRQAVGLLEWAAVERELESCFGPARELSTEPWRIETTPRAIIDAYESRIWSSTWLVSDEALRDAAGQARRWAIERWGSLDAPLSEEQQFVWYVFER